MMYSFTGFSPRTLSPGAFVAVMIAAVLLPGCASQVYRASQLPAEFAAAPSVDLKALNLSGLAGSAATQDVICWGDSLTIEIDAGLPSLEPRVFGVCVAKDGTAKIPLIDRVPVAGLVVEQAEMAVVEAARTQGIYPNPFVSIRIASPRKDRVTVVGAVDRPGVYELPRGSSSLMAALVSAGGLTDAASGDLEIRHTDPRLTSPGLVGSGGAAGDENGTRLASHEAASAPNNGAVRINLLDAASRGGGDQPLRDGDVVSVTKRELPPIHVLGLVTKPGSFDVKGDHGVYLLDAVALAGGTNNQVADRVTIRRRVPGQAQPVTIVASLREAMDGQDNVLLAPGDTVMVRQTPQTVVVGVISTFVRVGIGGTTSLF